MSVVIDLDQEVPITLTVGGVDDISHIVKNNHCVQGVCVLCVV